MWESSMSTAVLPHHGSLMVGLVEDVDRDISNNYRLWSTLLYR